MLWERKMERRRFANSPCPVRTDRFSFVLLALQGSQLHRHTLICSLLFSKCSAKTHRLFLRSNGATEFLVASHAVNSHQLQSTEARLSVLIRLNSISSAYCVFQHSVKPTRHK